MPRRKPLDWPDYMLEKRLRNGVGYYWNPPTWARKAGCPVRAEALGTMYAEAKRRCDDVLNPQFHAWRTGGQGSATPRVISGTFDWMISVYKAAPQYAGKPAKTRRSYDAAAKIVSDFTLKDGRRFGGMALSFIAPGAADKLHARIHTREDGTARSRTALLAMRVCQRVRMSR